MITGETMKRYIYTIKENENSYIGMYNEDHTTQALKFKSEQADEILKNKYKDDEFISNSDNEAEKIYINLARTKAEYLYSTENPFKLTKNNFILTGNKSSNR